MEPGQRNAVTSLVRVPEDERERLGSRRGEQVVIVERDAHGRRPARWSPPATFCPSVCWTAGPTSCRCWRGFAVRDLERELGIAIQHGVASFTPVRATKALASQLRVSRGSLLLYLQPGRLRPEGRPVLSSHEHHLADAFEFTVIRRGPGRRFT